MNPYSILNSRKRAIIALIHSVVFGLLAFYQLLTNYRPTPLVTSHNSHMVSAVALTIVYLMVTSVLAVLVWYSRANLEKLYFGFCTTSAAIGLWRIVVGDPTLHLGSLLRVLMLGCAVVTGTFILRGAPSPDNSLESAT
jgi:hypothetical protein